MACYHTPEALLHPGAPADIGGKAGGLLLLHRLGAPVPPWVVIPASQAGHAPWRAADHAEALRRLYAQWQEAGFSGMALRSSSLVEDAREASHAGVFETVFAETPEAIGAALDQVLASAENAPHAYRHVHGAAPMAIVLQAGVKPALAGVLFSAHPAEADPARAYVEAVYGHGHALVDGDAAPTRVWLEILSGKIAQCQPGEAGPLDLSEPHAQELVHWLLRIEDALEAPVDVEWAIDGERLWLLQARPITAMRLSREQSPPACATSWFFDQRFSEPIRPLTRSTLIELVARVAIGDALAIRGAVAPSPLIYDYAGQAYVAHEAFCRAFGDAPRWVLTPDLRQLFPEQCYCEVQGRPHAVRYLCMTVKALLLNAGDALLNLPRWRVFRDRVRDEIAALPPPTAEDADAWLRQWQELDQLNERFLRLHRWSLLWADYGYRIYGCLKHIAPASTADAWDTKLRREMRLPTAEANQALAEHLADPANATKRALLVTQFGHRSASLDYATPTWAELLETGELARAYPYMHAQSRREELQLPPRGLLSLVMTPLRRSLEMREEQRFAWERILARQRRLLREAARHLPGFAREDLWFLHWNELLALLRGEDGPKDDALQARKHAHWVYGACHRPPFIGPQELQPTATGDLQGTGAAGGMGRGCVRKVVGRMPDLRDDVEPVILVMAALDPAGTAVLQHCAGVILERGGLLSHAAIIARELDVPLVVGVPGVMDQLEDGVEVEIDGRSGAIRRVDEDGGWTRR